MREQEPYVKSAFGVDWVGTMRLKNVRPILLNSVETA